MIEVKEFQTPAQAAFGFRAILSAFSKPGSLVTLEDMADVPAPLHSGSASIAISLCDYQTPVWLSPKIDSPAVRSFLRFHTGAPIVEEPENASFAFFESSEFGKTYRRLSTESDEYPDRSATAIVQTSAFAGEHRVRLQGPGIEDKALLAVARMEREGWQRFASDHILFPRGIDVVFVASNTVVAVPRSTRITLTDVI